MPKYEKKEVNGILDSVKCTDFFFFFFNEWPMKLLLMLCLGEFF